MADLEAFRTEVQDWLEANCPASMRTPMAEDEVVWGGRNATFTNPDSKKWLDAMASKGWTAPTWPKEYGGGGLSKDENLILQQELRRIKARPALNSFGIWMLGPALLEFANEEQKKKFIPPIVRGEIRWCQGYSEPGAGSDLAGLQTRAVRDGDHFIVNGQKVWTSYADKADWIFCLVRTDTSVKHDGISFMLFDMASEGVSTKPIRLISGYSPFCETFFDDVKVPADQLVGQENKGWTIAKRLLQHERAMISGMGLGGALSGATGQTLAGAAKEYIGEDNGRVADPVVRQHITDHNMDSKAFALTMRRVAEEAKAGEEVSATSSVFKYFGTELNKRKYELLIETMGTKMLGWEPDDLYTDDEIGNTRAWLRSKANSIEGGTSEVQLNIIAKRVLGLPD